MICRSLGRGAGTRSRLLDAPDIIEEEGDESESMIRDVTHPNSDALLSGEGG